MQDDTPDKKKKPSGLSKYVANLLMADFAKKHQLPPAGNEVDGDDAIIPQAEKPQPPTSVQKPLSPADDRRDETLPYEFSPDKDLPVSRQDIEKMRKDVSLSVSQLMSDKDAKEGVKKPQRSHFEVSAMLMGGDEEDDSQFRVDREALREKHLAEKEQAKREFVYDDAGNLDELSVQEAYYPRASSQEVASYSQTEPEIKQSSVANYRDSYYAEASQKKPEKDAKPVFKAGDDVLKIICDAKREHVARQKSILLENRLREKVHSMPGTRGFLSAINARIAYGEDALIAEIKKASPSKGVIRADFEPGLLGRAYEEGGATCISVLTDRPYFQGRDEYISAVKRMCQLPVLRKDFILEPYQVVESRALGADCILLIMAALDLDTALELEKEAIALGMDVLVEVHNEKELDQALRLQTMLVGINNRDLKTFKVDLGVTERLAPLIPSPRTVVCESGIYNYADIQRMNQARVKAFLVGEALMSQEDVKRATQWLLGGE